MKVQKEKIGKIILWKPGTWLVAAASVIMLGLLLVPLIRIAFYSAPWYDDYNYGGFVKRALMEEYSLQSALKGAVYGTRIQWYAWQGTFSSIFFMTLTPVVWGEEYYFLGALFLIGMLTVSVWTLVMVLMRDVWKADRASGITLASAVTAMAVVMIHQPQQGFFWYNAGVHYVGMHSFLLLLIAAWLKLMFGRVGRVGAAFLVLWTLLGAVCAGGSNYVTSLQGILVGLSLILLGALLRKKQCFLLVPSILVYAAAFYVNISAPGNQSRGAIYRDCGMSIGALQAIWQSFGEAFHFMGRFSWQMTLAFMVLLGPIIWRIVKDNKCRFRYPGILLLWSFCLYATGFTSSLYVTGAVALARVVNAVKITYQILIFVNEVYWLGWICRKLQQGGFKRIRLKRNSEESGSRSKGVPLVFYMAMGLLMLGIFAADPIREHHYSSWAAYHYVHTGEANEFHKQYLQRIETIKNGDDIVRVDPYFFRPWILAVTDLSDDYNAEANAAMAGWYGKQGIICAVEEE